ncbi:MAG: DEAD/DEAH box helicase family protein, partial [Acholeplasmataceae bacterium]|nr:DEAD/DEAH box helicase family protein [Acholeplasmataceae bacterium]
MMYEKFDENTRVKFPATIHFLRLGYIYQSYNEALANGEIDFNTKIFTNHFRQAIEKINQREFSDEETKDIIDEIHQVLKNSDLGKEFYNWLISPVGKVKLIDFDNLDNNLFHVVNELKFGEQELGHFRPDINILINGIPIAFLEVKIPNNFGAIQVEFDRMVNKRYEQDEHKKYFNMIQLTCFSNNMPYESEDDRDDEPKAGSFYSTPNGNKTFFNFFREEQRITTGFSTDSYEKNQTILRDNKYDPNVVNSEEFKTNLSVTAPCNSFITSLFEKERLFYLLRYGITYVDQAPLEKHIMRYPQFFATRAILKNLDKEVKNGIVWHTQGSGKTALSIYCNRLLHDYYEKKGFQVRFFYVVDRLELLTQVSREFEKRNYDAIQVDSRDSFSSELSRAVTANATPTSLGNCVVVNIQKFSDSLPTIINPYGAKIQRVFFIDEAHRSYSKGTGEFYKNLMLVDRDAVFIALTGTPLLNKNERSNLRFGDYIHKYFYDRSILDGYTLKIKKEEMETVAKAEIKRNLELELKSRDTAKILESDEYITALGKYIDNDFLNFRYINNDSTIGAMIVCNSNPQAKKMQTWFEKNSKFNTRLIISDEDIPSVQNKQNQLDFKDYKNGIDILIVHLMLTTGYDVSRLKKMYLLRAPKEHTLLQTISRVNRPYKSPNGKTYQYGYISDFVDITEEYDRTITQYLEELKAETIDDEGEGTSPGNLVFDISKINNKYNNAIKTLTNIADIENLEEFSQLLTRINDKNALFNLRRLINIILDCKTEYLLSRQDEEAKKIDRDRFKKLVKLVQNRIDFLNVASNPLEVMSLLNKEIVEIVFMFVKRRTTILDMSLVSTTHTITKERLERLHNEIGQIKNKDDSRVVELNELLKKLFEKLKIADLNNIDSINVDLLIAINEVKSINDENDKLAADFEGNFA